MQDVFAGVDVGGTRIKIGLADRFGQLISREVLETKDCQGVECFLQIVSAKIQAMAKAISVPVLAIGVGCPGRIDFISGSVLWLKSKLEFLENVPLADRISDRLGCPVVCDNDVNTILTGEMQFGAGRGYQNVVAITVGTGIGGALVLNGQMVRGHNCATGHFGFMSHNPTGPRHVCGNTGIVEEYASQSGIQRELRRAFEAGEISPLTESLARGIEPGLREIFEVASTGDPFGCRLAERMISELGVLISNLIYAIDPELVLVGGGIMNHHPSLLDAVRRQVETRVDYLPKDAAEILPMTLGDVAGVLGGAVLAMDTIAKRKSGIYAEGGIGDKRDDNRSAPVGR